MTQSLDPTILSSQTNNGVSKEQNCQINNGNLYNGEFFQGQLWIFLAFQSVVH